MNLFVDCESSGPCIGSGDLIQFAAIAENGESFISEKFPPLCDRYNQGAYVAINIDRATHLAYTGDVIAEAKRFHEWLGQFRSCTFWSDNPAFDWQWINWLFHNHDLTNPFGFSARRIGDLYAGLSKDILNTKSWKKFRKTPHTHDPLDDARGNLEAFQYIRTTYNV